MKKITAIIACMSLLVPGAAVAQTTQKLQNTAYFRLRHQADKLLADKDSLEAAKKYCEAINANRGAVDLYEKVGDLFSASPEKQYLEKAREYYIQFCGLTDDDSRRSEAERKVKALEKRMEKLPEAPRKTAAAVIEPASPVTEQTEEPAPVKEAALLSVEPETVVAADSVAQPDSIVPPQPQYVVVEQDEVEEDPVTGELLIKRVKREVEVGQNVAAVAQNTADVASAATKPIREFTSTGKRNPFANATRTNKPAVAQPSQADNQADKLRQAYLHPAAVSANTPLYTLARQPETPLAPALDKLARTSDATAMSGRWQTTFHNQETLRELLILDVDSEARSVTFAPASDLLQWQDRNPTWKGQAGEATIDGGVLVCTYKIEFSAADVSEVGRFVAALLQPCFGPISTANRPLIGQLSGRSSTLPVVFNMVLKVKPVKNTLHGRLMLECTAGDGDEAVEILSQSLPCTLFPAPADYAGFDASGLTAESDTTAAAYVASLQKKETKSGNDHNNLGYCYLNGLGNLEKDYAEALKCFQIAQQEKCPESYANLYLMYSNGWGCDGKDWLKALECLAAGRRVKSADALNLSADLILDSPAHDDAAARAWFEQAVSRKSAYAGLRLGQMSATGDGRDTEMAIASFEKSQHPDAFYELAKLAVSNGDEKWYDVYKCAMQGARMGSVPAMQLMVEMYLSGLGVRQNFQTANNWKKKMWQANKTQLKGYRHVED